MNTFEITIQRKAGDAWPVVAEQSRPGSFLPVRSEGVLTLDPDQLLTELDPLRYGCHLGEALFSPDLRDGLTRALADSSNQLRVLLFVEADDLRTLRWERLCAPINNRWLPLARNAQALYSLYLPSVTDSRFPTIGRRDLRALVVVANPIGLERYNLAPFDLPSAVANLRAALGDLPFDLLASGTEEQAHLPHQPVGPATLDALCEQLTREKYTLLHVISQGLYNKRSGETALFLANAQGQVGRVTGSELIDRLRQLRGARGLPHLTYLASCASAPTEADGALGHLGQALVRDLGMPAVVAMLEQAPAAATQTLTQLFYQQLRQHGEVDRALVAASAGLSALTPPILYSRLGGRPLFNDLLAQDRPLTNAEIDFGLAEVSRLLPARAPVLLATYNAAAERLRGTLTAEVAALSPTLREERDAALAEIETLSSEGLDVSFSALALGQEPPVYDERCPYLGLAAFHAEQRAFFFGREPLVNKLVNRLAEHNFLAVLGGSGSGKSSLVLAGVVPALQAQNPNLAVHYLTPTSNPLTQLTKTLASADPTQPNLLVVDQFEELFTLCPDPTQRQQFLDHLLGLLDEKSKIENRKSKIVLTMRADFWGECASYPKLRELMQAHQELVGPMTAQELRSSMEQQARVVGLRFETDLSNTILDDVAGEPGAMPLLQHALLELWQRRHGRWLRAAEYRALGGVQQAIAGTADSIYTQLGDADRERMRAIFLRLTRLDEGGEGGEGQRDTRRRVRLAELAPAGDEADAVHRLVQRLADARLVMTTLRETAPSPIPLRQAQGAGEAPPPNRSLSLPKGADNGTDVSTRSQLPPRGEGWGGAAVVEVEVTHEALIRHWPRLRGWLDEGRTALRLRQSLSNAAAQWDAGARADSLLPRWNARLEETQRLAQNPRFGLNALERAYLDACIALREREAAEKEAQRQRELQQAQALAAEQRQRAEEQAQAAANLRKRAVFLAVAGALAVLLAIAAGWFGVRAQRSEAQEVKARATADIRRQEAEAAKAEADIQRDNAETQAKLARSRELGVHADTALAADNLDLALLLRIEGARTAPTPDMLNKLRLLLTQDQRTLKRIPGHNSPVTQARWNQDQSRLLIAYADGRAGVWDAATYTQVVTLAGHTARINVAVWQPADQQLLTAGDDGLLRIWDAVSGVQLRELTAAPERFDRAEWNADGSRILTVDGAGQVRIWAADQAESEPLTLPDSAGTVQLAHWNSAGDQILTASTDNVVRLWQVGSAAELLKELAGHEGLISSAAWNADASRILTASADKTAHIWDAASGEVLLTLAGHADAVTTAAWSPDEAQILTASLDGTARLWDAESGGELFTLAGQGAAVSQAFWSQDSTLVLTISDNAVQVWDALTGELFFELVGHTAKVTAAQWNADASQILTASEDGTVRLWDANPSAQPAGELPVLARHSGRIGQMRWNAAGDRLLTTGLDDATAQIVDAQSGAVVTTLAGHAAEINAAQWSQDEERVLTGSDDGTARMWDVATGQEIWQVQHAQAIYSVAWSPAEQTVLTASRDGTAMIWDMASRKALRMLRGHGSGVLLARWNHDGSRILTASRDDTARVWDAASGQQLLKLDSHTDEVTQAFWNRDESRIFTASDDATIKLWDAQSGALLQTFTGHSGVIHALRINRAETELLSASADGTARRWDIATGRELGSLQHEEAIFSALWSPDEQTILTTSTDGTAHLWDAQSSAAKATLSTYDHPIRQGLWNRDGSQVLTASDDGQVRQFYTQATAVITAACARGAIRNMTPDEWQQYMADDPYRVTCGELPAE